MFHPLVDTLSTISDAEVEAKIFELQKKYFSTSNPDLQLQIQSILEMYREELKARLAKQKQQQLDQDNDLGLDNLINVS
jgi:hypothetical protein